MLYDEIIFRSTEIKPIRRGYQMKKIIIGVDTETNEGPPITFQFWSKNAKFTTIVWTNARNSFDHFVDYLDSLPSNDFQYIMYGHNLQFDMVSLFYSHLKELKNEEYNFVYRNWNFKGVFSNLCYGICYHTKNRKTVYLIDTFAFFPTSLMRLSEMFVPKLPKLSIPRGLGHTKFSCNDEHFKKYAMRDAEIAYYVGEGIDKLHEEYDIKQTVSRANMAGVIFRKKYLEKPIVLPNKKIMYSCLHSYHGGKNGLYCKPGLYKNVYGLDIISAYPAAMATFPSFYNPNLYFEISWNGGRVPKEFPKLGIYKIWGEVQKCVYPIIFGHGFKPVFGKIDGIWLTSYELQESIQSGELKLSKLEGYFYDEKQDKEKSPWSSFAKEFFELKNTAKNSVDREFFKVILNSLYGKTIEMQRKNSETEIEISVDKNDKAEMIKNDVCLTGPLFHPFIASLITGYCRAQIHRMEHKYKALHTSTDGIFTQQKPEEIFGLGGEKIDFHGPLYIWRNKLYAGYTKTIDEALKDKKKKPIKSLMLKNHYLKKYAAHGYHGTITQLEKCTLDGTNEYTHEHVNKLKESLKRGLVPNKFVKRKAIFNLPGGKT
jgi:hypothetical protein